MCEHKVTIFMKKNLFYAAIVSFIIISLFSTMASASALSNQELTEKNGDDRPLADKILLIGDSMTGWIGERLNAYGLNNGFEVSTIVWDGSTISKWGSRSSRIKEYVDKLQPDAIFICLGLNELAERNPESRLSASLDKILTAAGDVPVIWIGPPSWPNKPFGETLDSWLAKKLGDGHYYSSFGLSLARQSNSNPHPSRSGIDKWVDALMVWIPDNGSILLPGYKIPDPKKPHSRGKIFIYKRMKETL